jgi:hypothetical protein
MPVKTLPFGAPLQLVALFDAPIRGTHTAVFTLKRADGRDVYCADASKKATVTVRSAFTGENAHAHTTAQGPWLNEEESCLLDVSLRVEGRDDLGTIALGQVRVYHDWIAVVTVDADTDRERATRFTLSSPTTAAQTLTTDDAGASRVEHRPFERHELRWPDGALVSCEPAFNGTLGRTYRAVVRRPKVKVAIKWPAPGQEHKQYVNLAYASPGHVDQGETLKLVVKVTEAPEAGITTPTEVIVTATFGVDNVLRRIGSAAVGHPDLAAAGWTKVGTRPVFTRTFTVEAAQWVEADGERTHTLDVPLGHCGGDKVTLTATTVKDDPGASVTVVNWRELFCNLFAPAGVAALSAKLTAALASINTMLGPVFIKVTTKGAVRDLPGGFCVDFPHPRSGNPAGGRVAFHWVEWNKLSTLRNTAFEWGGAERSAAEIHKLLVFMVDGVCDLKEVPFDAAGTVVWDVDQRSSTKTFKLPFPYGLGPIATDRIVRDVTHGYNVVLPGAYTVTPSADRRSFDLAVDKSQLNLGTFSSMKLKVRFRAYNEYRGFSNGGRFVFCGTPDASPAAEVYTFVHELAHALGETSQTRHDACDPSDGGTPAHPYYAKNHGFTGPHCYFGLEGLSSTDRLALERRQDLELGPPNLLADYHRKDKYGKCIMWGAGGFKNGAAPTSFCPDCVLSLRATPCK